MKTFTKVAAQGGEITIRRIGDVPKNKTPRNGCKPWNLKMAVSSSVIPRPDTIMSYPKTMVRKLWFWKNHRKACRFFMLSSKIQRRWFIYGNMIPTNPLCWIPADMSSALRENMIHMPS